MRIFLFLLIAPFFLPLIVHAAVCDLSAGVKNLEEARSAPAADYFESVRRELTARKELLYSAVGCLAAETQELKQQAEALPDAQDAASTKRELTEKIRNAQEFLEREKDRIENLGIQGTKDTARDLKGWRETAYSQLTEDLNNLTTWTGNQNLFETAEGRLKQINQTVRFLKLLENDEIRSMYEKSEAQLKTAGGLHSRALANIKEHRRPEEISSSLKTSLEALSQTYKNFLELSEAVKKILPL